MKKYSTRLPDVLIFEPTVHGDQRGFFMETWRNEWFAGIEGADKFVQDNHSKSKRGTLRGLHYQTSNTQGKFIRVVKGQIYDVAVDMRASSPTFGKWAGEMLSAENQKSLWIPPGFAHGFYVVSEEAEITYKCTHYYAAEYERTLLWNDPQVGITWPLIEDKVILSDKDWAGNNLIDCETFP
jgi:dTDP-4-dehydrorhamnose 3,5-epimerase